MPGPEPINPNYFLAESNGNVCDISSTISLRCPHCQQLGSFGTATNRGIAYNKRNTNQSVSHYIATIRICPNPNCKGLLFVITKDGHVVEVEPPQLLDFDLENLPASCQSILKEAIACHAAGAYRAAAMMVRRLLEEICDLNKAQGNNLHSRLEALKSIITLPQALFEAMSELKALGNDAAHIEAKAYDNIGSEEAADSIELVKEILKSLYQLQGLVSRLQARKKASP